MHNRNLRDGVLCIWGRTAPKDHVGAFFEKAPHGHMRNSNIAEEKRNRVFKKAGMERKMPGLLCFTQKQGIMRKGGKRNAGTKDTGAAGKMDR